MRHDIFMSTDLNKGGYNNNNWPKSGPSEIFKVFVEGGICPSLTSEESVGGISGGGVPRGASALMHFVDILAIGLFNWRSTGDMSFNSFFTPPPYCSLGHL